MKCDWVVSYISSYFDGKQNIFVLGFKLLANCYVTEYRFCAIIDLGVLVYY